MRTSVFSGLAVAVALAPAHAPSLSATDHAECSHLTMLKLPDVKVTDATAVPAAATGALRAAHCRFNGVIGGDIKFTLLMPDEWNHKFMMGGGGGFVGGVQNQAVASLNAGYATVGTDTGHTGGITEAKWALGHPERQVNFGFLAVHRTAEVAKTIVRSYYGGNETRSYFSGCSNGGRQGLMEAQRYPDDFDGIVSGAPAYDFTAVGAQFIKDIQAAFPDPRTLAPVLTPDVLKSVEAQIVAKCDALDGVKDGLIEDPRACKVDVASLTGLTDAQRTALKTIYGETRNKDGVLYPAQPVGGEGEGAGWPAWITGSAQATPGLAMNAPSARFAFGTELFKYFVFDDPAWDYSKYEFSSFRKDTAKTATILNATSPDLDAFKSKNHKLILWHGWSDPALTALGSIKYYEQVQARDPKSPEYFRMFMMPGVLHCAGGPGPDTADWTAAIDEWVEKGTAPERIVARKLGAGGAVTRTRPLCAYPQKAVYKGSGSIDEADSFVCK